MSQIDSRESPESDVTIKVVDAANALDVESRRLMSISRDGGWKRKGETWKGWYGRQDRSGHREAFAGRLSFTAWWLRRTARGLKSVS